MPNFDGGHYFLTVLAPVMPGTENDARIDASRSHRQLLLEALAELPTSEISPSSAGTGQQSPFTRNGRTHLARFVLIDSPAYNGRLSGDTLLDKIRGLDPMTPQPVDTLTTPFLLFAGDFDARDGSDSSLRAITDGLWQTIEPELRRIFGHCLGFSRVDSESAFFDYIKRCQIETTMPFNDYWAGALAVPSVNLLPPVALVAVSVLGVAASVFRIDPLPLWLPALSLLASVYILYRAVIAGGRRPMPAAPNSDLPSVLAALHQQKHFTDFAIANQGVSDEALYAAFSDFLKDNKPAGPERAMQLPGIIPNGEGIRRSRAEAQDA